MKHQELTSRIIGICIKVHAELGPGLLESVYEEAICYELDKNNIEFKRQQGFRVKYDEKNMGKGFRADIIVDNKVVLEVKSKDMIVPVDSKIVLTYLRFTEIEVGLLVNFKVVLLKDGITRLILDRKRSNP
ncbi:MAG: GxxExxY protein [Saprospiraceae bacterium]